MYLNGIIKIPKKITDTLWRHRLAPFPIFIFPGRSANPMISCVLSSPSSFGERFDACSVDWLARYNRIDACNQVFYFIFFLLLLVSFVRSIRVRISRTFTVYTCGAKYAFVVCTRCATPTSVHRTSICIITATNLLVFFWWYTRVSIYFNAFLKTKKSLGNLVQFRWCQPTRSAILILYYYILFYINILIFVHVY